VDAKYGCNRGGWCLVDPPGSYGVGHWKYIRRGWRIFSSHTRFDPGDGTRIRFWDDVCGWEVCLKTAVFPLPYNIALVKEASVATNMDLSSGIIHWNIIFICLAHDWEVEMLASFYSLLYSFRGRRGGVDKLWWIPSHKGIFDIRSFYKILAHKDNPSFPWKSIWRTKAPLKVAFFAWSATLGKILTMDNLRKRQLIVVNRCCLCNVNGEFVDHLLLYCEVACSLWNAIFRCFGLSWVMPNDVKDLFACWWLGGNSWSAVIWKMLPLCIMRCLWRERNDRSFKNLERTLEELKSSSFFPSLLG
jgi:hypothetical protein